MFNHFQMLSVTCSAIYIYVEIEDPEHFLFNCPRYVMERRELFVKTRPYHPLSVQKLLYGNDNLSDVENELVFHEVQNFIKRTRRFEID